MKKSIFLDVACFFYSEKFDSVSRILSTYRDDESNVINDLVDKCMVTISDNRLEMHDLLLKMGKDIGYESSINEVGKRSRLRDPKEICRILRNKNKVNQRMFSFVFMNVVLSTTFLCLFFIFTFPGHQEN